MGGVLLHHPLEDDAFGELRVQPKLSGKSDDGRVVFCVDQLRDEHLTGVGGGGGMGGVWIGGER